MTIIYAFKSTKNVLSLYFTSLKFALWLTLTFIPPKIFHLEHSIAKMIFLNVSVKSENSNILLEHKFNDFWMWCS